MRYAYYSRLKRREQAIYRRSDAIERIVVPRAERLHPLVTALEAALAAADRAAVERAARVLVEALLAALGVPPVKVRVLSVRPADGAGELHGLYVPRSGRARAVISVWMRTAHHKRTVAFRTFLRTLLHEVCHHLDYELHGLEESFHTEGFFKRESSLFKQLVPDLAAR